MKWISYAGLRRGRIALFYACMMKIFGFKSALTVLAYNKLYIS